MTTLNFLFSSSLNGNLRNAVDKLNKIFSEVFENYIGFDMAYQKLSHTGFRDYIGIRTTDRSESIILIAALTQYAGYEVLAENGINDSGFYLTPNFSKEINRDFDTDQCKEEIEKALKANNNATVHHPELTI